MAGRVRFTLILVVVFAGALSLLLLGRGHVSVDASRDVADEQTLALRPPKSGSQSSGPPASRPQSESGLGLADESTLQESVQREGLHEQEKTIALLQAELAELRELVKAKPKGQDEASAGSALAGKASAGNASDDASAGNAPDEAPEASATPAKRPARQRSLISYAYTETPSNRANLIFFIQHGLYASADFVFTFNGETDAHKLLPSHPESPVYDPAVTNIEALHRPNTCLDFGAHAEALLREWDAEHARLTPMTDKHRGGTRFFEAYDRFILMNSSVRGPFIPYWSMACWAEALWAKLTAKVKVCLEHSWRGG
jgi:hypothetical protein